MADSPYISWYTSDFLNGVADLTLEQIGVYTVVLALIADRGSPITDDPAWISRRCGTSVRNCRKIISELDDLGKIQRRNGLIGNKRMLIEVRKRSGKSNQAREAANAKWTQWRAENKPQLDFGETGKNSPKKSEKDNNNNASSDADAQSGENGPKSENHEIILKKSATFFEDKDEIISPLNSGISQENNETSDADALDSRACVLPELDSIRSNDQDSNLGRDAKNGREIDRSIGPEMDLMKLLERVGRAAGFVPTNAQRITSSIDLIKSWRDEGIDFDTIVIPVIERTISESHDPTASLFRFDKQIRHQHARSIANRPNGSAQPKPLAPPITEVDGEPEQITAIRKALLETFGVRKYVIHCNRIAFKSTDAVNGSKILRIIRPPSQPFPVLEDDRSRTIKAIAKLHGFSDVWE